MKKTILFALCFVLIASTCIMAGCSPTKNQKALIIKVKSEKTAVNTLAKLYDTLIGRPVEELQEDFWEHSDNSSFYYATVRSKESGCEYNYRVYAPDNTIKEIDLTIFGSVDFESALNCVFDHFGKPFYEEEEDGIKYIQLADAELWYGTDEGAKEFAISCYAKDY